MDPAYGDDKAIVKVRSSLTHMRRALSLTCLNEQHVEEIEDLEAGIDPVKEKRLTRKME